MIALSPSHAAMAYGPQPALQRRIGLLAGNMQVGAILWFVAVLLQTLIFWGRPQHVREVYSRILGVDVSQQSVSAFAAAVMLVGLVVLCGAWLAVRVWQLAGTYRRGGAFTVEAATRLRGLALAGLVSLGADIVVRHLVAPVMTFGLPGGPHFTGPWITSQDLLYGLMILFLFALSGIFLAAAEMAEDQAAIV
ncbi:DUF2975 domain-containing protein [Alsobacter sp. KACC 23698]|uniref:DUF2975 domain-containing protein n=1 Tax=Alsobacter sp. KACC 23698 TaxID=3149229 RepID=A0AAU7JAH8_9HYPH